MSFASLDSWVFPSVVLRDRVAFLVQSLVSVEAIASFEEILLTGLRNGVNFMNWVLIFWLKNGFCRLQSRQN